jgi:hypothetical protein
VGFAVVAHLERIGGCIRLEHSLVGTQNHFCDRLQPIRTNSDLMLRCFPPSDTRRVLR